MDSLKDIVPLGEWKIFGDKRPAIIAGPCSAESEEQLMASARAVKAAGIDVFRAGIWKPRTRVGYFEGVGTEGFAWMQRVQKELGLKVCTEVASRNHVEECLAAGMDMLWIGARTTVNPFLVQEIADALRGHDIPVFVKNPASSDLGLWIGAIERLYEAGIRKIGVIHRGFSILDERRYRNAPLWQLAIEFRSRFPQIPFLCDPSHMGGKREYVAEISQRAMNMGLDGLMIEAHCDPSCALSDADQQLGPQELVELMKGLQVRDNDSQDASYMAQIEELRSQIDSYDNAIMSALAGRMDVSRQMGEFKRRGNIAILQTSRWEDVMSRLRELANDYGLDEEFVAQLYSIIHQASVNEQNLIIDKV